MEEWIRTRDEIYKIVSSYYKNKGLEKSEFSRRLKAVNDVLVKEMSLKESLDWWITGEIEFYWDWTQAEISKLRRRYRKELKGILESLDFKVYRNEITDLRKVEKA